MLNFILLLSIENWFIEHSCSSGAELLRLHFGTGFLNLSNKSFQRYIYARITLCPPLGAMTFHICAELAPNWSEFRGLTNINAETQRTRMASSFECLPDSTRHMRGSDRPHNGRGKGRVIQEERPVQLAHGDNYDGGLRTRCQRYTPAWVIGFVRR